MIGLWIYLVIAFSWGCYNAIVETPKYIKKLPQKVGGTEITAMYIINIIAGTILFPISFYQKIFVKRRNTKNEKLDK